MPRSSAFRDLQRAVAIARFADRNGLPTREAVQRFQARLVERHQVRLASPSRRDVLKGLGSAAGLVGMGAAFAPGRAVAARPDGQNAEVAIVGSGMAGLSCAYTLQKSGVYATVYDATTRPGGRVRSYGGAFGGTMFPSQVAELGGELIDTGHTTMRGYATEFRLDLEDYGKVPGEVLWYLGGGLVGEEAVVDEFRAFNAAMNDDLKLLSPPTATSFTDDDETFDYTTLAEYLQTRGAGDTLYAAIDAAYRGEYGLEIDQQSCLNFLLFIHQDKRSQFAEFGQFSDERFHVVGGNQQIPDAIASRLQGQLELGAWLLRVAKTASGRYELTFQQDGGGTFTRSADMVVLATPFSTLRNVDLDASLGLPDWKTYAIDNLVYGANAKTMIGFQGEAWAAYGCNGSVYAELADCTNTWQTSRAMATATEAILTDYAGGDRSSSLSQAGLQSQVAAFLADLDRVMPGISAQVRRNGTDVAAVLQHWPTEPTHLGSYTCNHPGYFTTICENEGRPVGNLFFAGEHADSFYAWQGFMEGAANSGIAAASEILSVLRSPKY
ncbi:MAG: FAD-dependent oxidoreductase [Alphaproteobacteria bacterium]|nr:FAD-dependent oxidoreductase [Alphaproteobacteria bacterium]